MTLTQKKVGFVKLQIDGELIETHARATRTIAEKQSTMSWNEDTCENLSERGLAEIKRHNATIYPWPEGNIRPLSICPFRRIGVQRPKGSRRCIEKHWLFLETCRRLYVVQKR